MTLPVGKNKNTPKPQVGCPGVAGSKSLTLPSGDSRAGSGNGPAAGNGSQHSKQSHYAHSQGMKLLQGRAMLKSRSSNRFQGDTKKKNGQGMNKIGLQKKPREKKNSGLKHCEDGIVLQSHQAVEMKNKKQD